MTVRGLLLGVLSIRDLMLRKSDTERKDKSQSTAEYLGAALKPGIWPFTVIYRTSESLPERTLTETFLLSIVRAAGIMSLSQQTVASVLQQDRIVIKN